MFKSMFIMHAGRPHPFSDFLFPFVCLVQYYAARGPTAQLIMTGEEATEIFEGSRRYFTDGDFYEVCETART